MRNWVKSIKSFCLLDHIKRKGVAEIIEPTYEEYKAFFDEFYGEYEIVDGPPESDACNSFEVKFKVVLEVDK